MSDDNEPDEYENNYEKRMIEDNIALLKCGISVVENILNRQRNIDDPVVRYSIFVDKMSLILDMGYGVLKGYVDNDKYPVDLRDKLDKVCSDLQKDLDGLMSWVRKPVYSPNHPFGSQIMNQSNVDFKNQTPK